MISWMMAGLTRFVTSSGMRPAQTPGARQKRDRDEVEDSDAAASGSDQEFDGERDAAVEVVPIYNGEDFDGDDDHVEEWHNSLDSFDMSDDEDAHSERDKQETADSEGAEGGKTERTEMDEWEEVVRPDEDQA